MNKPKQILFVLIFLISFSARGQVINLGSFDMNVIHYGIQVGYTQSKFDFDFSENEQLREMIQGATSYYAAGFHLAVIGDLKLTNFINLRFLPGITLINRNIHYDWEEGYFNSHNKLDTKRTVESVYGELPLDIKFRAMRWRNMRPYVTGGISYGFDFASLRNNKSNNNLSIVKLNTSDFRYTIGVGSDFYLRYVKFAVELKMAFGIPDLKIPDNDPYSQSTVNLYTRSVMLGFTFEG